MLDPTAPQTRVLPGGLPWPSVRGSRLLQSLCGSQEAQEPSTQNDSEPSDEFPYDLELCVPTAGHVALVLVKRPPVSSTTRTTHPPTPSAKVAAPADPRVVYVLDALPPSGRGFEGRAGAKGKNPVQLAQQVDELELLEELFAPHTRAAGGKDGSVLMKAPLLCARFDCKVVSIRFLRSSGSVKHKLSRSSSRGLGDAGALNTAPPSSSRVVGAAAPLRCVVAREDGMAYLWEWQADLFQWVFLNRMCFLENPNLKWTRPVAAFTTTDLPLDCDAGYQGQGEHDGSGSRAGSSGATEFVWWSTATKHEPKLKLRRLRFERATDALRATDVVVGSAFTPKPSCDSAVKLMSSKLGLFVITEAQGVFFRSSTASLRTVSLDWKAIFGQEKETTPLDLSEILMCLHSVTGELVLFQRKSGEVYIVTPKPLQSSAGNKGNDGDSGANALCNALYSRRLTTISLNSQSNEVQLELDAVDMAAHRHLLLVLTRQALHVYTLITGKLLEAVSLPIEMIDGGGSSKFWTISGSASSVGLWGDRGFWTIRLPSAKAVGASLHGVPMPNELGKNDQAERDPESAFLAVKDYGTGDLHLDAVRYALEVLERVTPLAMDPTHHHPEAWEAVWHTVSSPSLLLALLDNHATSEHVVRELAQHVAALYSAARSIRSFGRLDGSATTNKKADQLLRLTPANLESLHHLSNWIVLAKRKLARLDGSSSKETSAGAGNRQSRAVSELTGVLASETTPPSAPSSQSGLTRKDSVVDPEDARNFRLSRKLRPMSSLRFAAGCSTNAERQGRQWLLQLEAFLLDGVAFKEQQPGAGFRAIREEATPSHRLFHSERVLADFRNVSASSFSKHMYLESMSRLYLLHEPASLLPFIRCVERFCPRLFSLSGHQPMVRSHAERALTLFPPLEFFTNKLTHGTNDAEVQAAKASLLAYVDLLIYCGRHAEACRSLLSCHLYEDSKRKLLELVEDPRSEQSAGESEQEQEASARNTASTTVYFLLLEYCVVNCDAIELKALLMLKPKHVDMLHVLWALRSAFSAKSKQEGNESGVTVGDLRSVLRSLMQQRRIGKPTRL